MLNYRERVYVHLVLEGIGMRAESETESASCTDQLYRPLRSPFQGLSDEKSTSILSPVRGRK